MVQNGVYHFERLVGSDAFGFDAGYILKVQPSGRAPAFALPRSEEQIPVVQYPGIYPDGAGRDRD